MLVHRLGPLLSAAITCSLLVAVANAGNAPRRFEPGSAKQNQEQLDRFTKHLAEHPQDVDALVARGFAYYALREFDRGDADVSKAIELAPKNPSAWRVRGRGLSIRDKFDEAISAFDRSIEFGESDPRLFVERAMTFEMSGDRGEAIGALGEAIDRNPDNAEAYFCRAGLLNANDQWGQAQADYQKAIEHDPKKLVYRVGRSVAFFEHEEFDRGFADILAAMRLNPGDVGVDYQPTSDKELSEVALRHGEEQVRQMLKDRPAMAEHISPGDKLWTWAVRKFAGEDLGSLIDWDPDSPEPFPGRSGRPMENRHAFIRVAATPLDPQCDRQQQFELLWSSAVFELHNVTSSADWNMIERQLAERTLTRDQYILAMLNSEELATQRARAFYLKFFVAWLKSKQLKPCHPDLWDCTTFRTAGDSRTELAIWGNDARIPWYGDQYDLATVRQAYEQGDHRTARNTIDTLLAKDGELARDTLTNTLYWLGCLELAEQNVDAAVTAFDRAIEAAPEEQGAAEIHRVKGIAEATRQRFDRALEEFNKALRLDPLAVDPLVNRAYEYARRGEQDAALEDFTAAIELQPDEAMLYVYRGQFWVERKDFVRSEQDFGRAVELAPDDPHGYRGRANTNYDRGNLDEAIRNWDAAIERSPDDYSLYVERGTAHGLKQHQQQAYDDFAAAIRLAPELPDGYATRAELLLSRDDPQYFRPDEAMRDAKRSCELTNWNSGHELSLLAAAHAAKGGWDDAIQWQLKALEKADPHQRRDFLRVLEEYRSQRHRGEDEHTP